MTTMGDMTKLGYTIPQVKAMKQHVLDCMAVLNEHGNVVKNQQAAVAATVLSVMPLVEAGEVRVGFPDLGNPDTWTYQAVLPDSEIDSE